MKKPSKSRAPKCRILIVDDHPMTRAGLAMLLGGEADLEVCGEAATAESGLAAVLATRPNLVLTDISLPGKNGLELIKDIHAVRPDLPVLVVSMHAESTYAERSLQAGGRGYIMKSEPGDAFLTAIRTILRGGISVSEQVSNQILQRLGPNGAAQKSGVASLTNREFEIYQLLGEGMETQMIATRIHISAKTVHFHLAAIKVKLGKSSLHELIAAAASWAAAGRD